MTPDSAAVAAIGRDVVVGLEWRQNKATSLGLEYHVWWYELGKCWLAASFTRGVGGHHTSEGEAKAAAQADYATRILSALDPAFIARIEALEVERVAEWNRRREAEAGRDVEKAVADTFKAENARLRCALEETEEVLALSENTPFPDPAYHDEVKRLGLRIGFGALMSTAERAWREVAEELGHPAGGEFVSGPCRVTLDTLLSQVRSALARTTQEATNAE